MFRNNSYGSIDMCNSRTSFSIANGVRSIITGVFKVDCASIRKAQKKKRPRLSGKKMETHKMIICSKSRETEIS